MTDSRSLPPEPNSIRHTGQALSAMDSALLSVDRILRGIGAPGFETQALVWLDGRIDMVRLRLALTRLSERHPVVASRLVGEEAARPCWQFRRGAVSPLREITLPSIEPESVWAVAARILSTPNDPATEDPVRFHVLHRPHGQDVFLMQYNHALMDNNASVLLLREIDRLSLDATGDPGDASDCDLLREYLQRYSRDERRKAVERTFRLWGRSLRGGTVRLSGNNLPAGSPIELRIANRCLDENETASLRAYVVKTCGMPSVSMAVLASVFRAMAPLAHEHWAGGRNFMVGIGVDLGLRGKQGPIFRNLMSIVPMHVRTEDVEYRDEAVRLLNKELRERLTLGADLGMLQWVTLMSRRRQPDTLWALEHGLRRGFSLWYAHFGSQDAIGRQFCGAPIADVNYVGPAWPGPGITLLVNQFRGRLLLQATYIPEVVPEPLANTFLDQLIGDLTG